MNARKTIQKILFVLMWISIGAGMLTLLVAAISKKNRDRCSDYEISINGVKNSFFLDEKDVLQLLAGAGMGNIKGQLISDINLRRLESLLEDNVCVKDAQLYIDNRDVLHIIIKERKPVARIFTRENDTYYIDENKIRMPLSDKMSANVPVFTGFPQSKLLNEKDSLLLDHIKTTALFIINDSFWMSQVAQIDITEQRTFEMIPLAGNHLVLLGDGEHIDKKFHRLFVFYKEILSKTGLDKYPVLDLRYEGQVVAVKDTKTKSRIDTSQLRLNVQKLLQKAKQIKDDSEAEEKIVNDKTGINADTSTISLNGQNIKGNAKKTTEVKQTETKLSPQPLKTTSDIQSDEKEKVKKGPPGNRQEPKAVMPKKNENN